MQDFASLLQPDRGQPATSLHLIDSKSFDAWLGGQSGRIRSLLAAQGFRAGAFETAVVPDGNGDGWSAVVGLADAGSIGPWSLARAAERLPEGSYRIVTEGVAPDAAMLGWLLAHHRFGRFRAAPAPERGPRILLTAAPAHMAKAVALAEATALVRDLVDMPAGDLGPRELEDAVAAVARECGAETETVSGDALDEGYPMIAAVGRAAIPARAPRLISLGWGDPGHPRVAIVGKGVCFDSGGLDIKNAAGMRLMKKDMGGAAHALALARLVMKAGLPVRLNLLIPAVENAVSGAAFRPGDVLRSRKGLTVEIGNTDAEGRLVLADALTRAGEDGPELVLDFATLTGAARVALGPDLPALFANDDALADALLEAGRAAEDPLWRMPLHAPYAEMLSSDIADIGNASDGPMAGAVTAALFLQRFVPAGTAWAHMDVFAWRPKALPGRPKGGEALGLRAAFAMLEARYRP